MEIQLKPHVCKESTSWGVVEKPLNQHIVFMKNEDSGQFVQCGYVGVKAFLPLAGFPQELCAGVAAECSKVLKRPVDAGIAPPGLGQIVDMINSQVDEDEDE